MHRFLTTFVALALSSTLAPTPRLAKAPARLGFSAGAGFGRWPILPRNDLVSHITAGGALREKPGFRAQWFDIIRQFKEIV